MQMFHTFQIIGHILKYYFGCKNQKNTFHLENLKSFN